MLEFINQYERKLVKEIQANFSDDKYLNKLKPVLDYVELARQWAILGNNPKALRCLIISSILYKRN